MTDRAPQAQRTGSSQAGDDASSRRGRMPRPRALITGASSGLGRGYARALAGDGYDLVLVARDERRLRELSDQLGAAHAINAEVVAADLARRDGIDAVAEVIDTQQIDVLINNAGYGLRGSLLESDIAALNDQDQVLTGAVRELSLLAARRMRARGRGGIVTVSSLAAVTTMGQYAAFEGLNARVHRGARRGAAEQSGDGHRRSARVHPDGIPRTPRCRPSRSRSALAERRPGRAGVAA